MSYNTAETKDAITAPFRNLYPFKSNFHTIQSKNGGPDLSYHYIDEGDGEVVLMLHGNPTWSFYYRSLIQTLLKTNRTIVPDHMGCGLSDKPFEADYGYTLKDRVEDLASLLDALKIKGPITLIAHDWGGMIGLTYLLKKKISVQRIILMNTSGFFPPNLKKIPLRLKLIRNTTLFSRLAVLGLNAFARGAIYMAPKKSLSKQVKKGLLAPYDRPLNRMATLKFVQDIPLYPHDPSYDLAKYTDDHLLELSSTPMLFLWGQHDFVFDMDYFNEFKRRFPKADFHLFKDAGHYVLEDVPEKLIPLIKDFMKT